MSADEIAARFTLVADRSLCQCWPHGPYGVTCDRCAELSSLRAEAIKAGAGLLSLRGLTLVTFGDGPGGEE